MLLSSAITPLRPLYNEGKPICDSLDHFRNQVTKHFLKFVSSEPFDHHSEEWPSDFFYFEKLQTFKSFVIRVINFGP